VAHHVDGGLRLDLEVTLADGIRPLRLEVLFVSRTVNHLLIKNVTARGGDGHSSGIATTVLTAHRSGVRCC